MCLADALLGGLLAFLSLLSLLLLLSLLDLLGLLLLLFLLFLLLRLLVLLGNLALLLSVGLLFLNIAFLVLGGSLLKRLLLLGAQLSPFLRHLGDDLGVGQAGLLLLQSISAALQIAEESAHCALRSILVLVLAVLALSLVYLYVSIGVFKQAGRHKYEPRYIRALTLLDRLSLSWALSLVGILNSLWHLEICNLLQVVFIFDKQDVDWDFNVISRF